MKIELNKNAIFKAISYASLLYFIYLLILITLQYIPINYEVAFLRIKEEEIKWTHYKWAFFSHVFSSILVIVAGVSQFSNTIRSSFPSVHRLNGKVYILLTLLIASPSGLVLAYYANGGIISKISFSLLSILWFFFTFKALSFVRKGDFVRHRNFMIRSYALTLSAVSLRLFKYILVTLFELPPMDTYRIVSILGWTVNLVVAEIIIRKYYECVEIA